MNETAVSASPQSLPYARPAPPLSRLTALHVAAACGALPLVTGLAVFGAWLLSGWSWLAGAGFCVILGGCVLFLVGVVALGTHVVRGVRSGSPTRRALARDAVLYGLLLIINFPVAAWCVRNVAYIMFAYVVSVSNTSNTPIQSFVISGPGFATEVGPIAPGQRVSRLFHIATDGEVTYSASHAGVTTNGVISGYVTNNMDADELLTVSAPGVVGQASLSRVPIAKWKDMR